MARLDTLQDAIALVRHSRVVDAARLDDFLNLFRSARVPLIDPVALLGLMVERGLLTCYQADELAAGREGGLWVGGHRILDRLGRGGMGEVFLAEHALLGRRVAVKVLTGGCECGVTARERFGREAEAAAAVDHPNVVRVLAADVTHDPPFLVMEYVDGVSLQAAVARHGVFTPAETAAVGVQVANGLQAAADAGLVHRDIKPANLLVDRTGLVKILDLGIARFTREPSSRLSDGSVVLGTLDYIAPEQAVDSSTVDVRADLYSLGATLYFLLAGQPPFPDEDVYRKLDHKQSIDPPPLLQLRPDVGAGLAGVIHRLLARDAAGRYASPAAAAAALAPWANTGPDFPARLFAPWRPPAADSIDASTELGYDRDPTPLPPTRRITWHQAVRPAERPPDPPPAPAHPRPVPRPAPPPAPPDDTTLSGPPTVPLRPLPSGPRPAGATHAGEEQPRWRPARVGRAIWWVVGAALVLAGAIAATALRAGEWTLASTGSARP
jgi:serine/threonine protein kinase